MNKKKGVTRNTVRSKKRSRKRGATGLRIESNDPRDFGLSNPKVTKRLKNTNVSLFGALGMSRSEMPKGALLDPSLMPSITNQGNDPSCVGHSFAGIMSYYSNLFGKNLSFSPIHIWNMGMQFEGVNNSPIGPKSALSQMQLQGSATVSEYSANNFKKIGDRQIKEYYRLDADISRRDEILTRIKEHILSGIPVMFGLFFTHEAWDQMDDNTGLIPRVGTSVKEGHAMVIVGYDDTNKWLIVRNSWGASWGDKGHAKVPYEWVTSGYTGLFWVITVSEFANIDNDLKQYVKAELRKKLSSYANNPKMRNAA